MKQKTEYKFSGLCHQPNSTIIPKTLVKYDNRIQWNIIIGASLFTYTCYTDYSQYEVQVARKWFQAKGDFRKEAKNLAKLNESLSDHKRIVKYLAMFTIGDEEDRWASKEFNILLPLADTDLKKFLYEPEYSPKCTTIAHMVEEASNLADAIRWLHAGLRISGKVLICCHMDLKLDNVLVYLRHTASPVGWWKISDFGISSMTERQHETPDPRRPSASFLEVQEVRSPAESLARITGTIRASVQRPAGIYSAPGWFNPITLSTAINISFKSNNVKKLICL